MSEDTEAFSEMQCQKTCIGISFGIKNHLWADCNVQNIAESCIELSSKDLKHKGFDLRLVTVLVWKGVFSGKEFLWGRRKTPKSARRIHRVMQSFSAKKCFTKEADEGHELSHHMTFVVFKRSTLGLVM